MDNYKINLKSKRKISLSGNNNIDKKPSSPPKKKISIRIPEEDQAVLIQIELKMQNLGVKRVFDQDKWHIGLNVFNKLLDCVNKTDVDKDTDILEYLEKMIDEKFQNASLPGK
ncbi:MAG: hypothetical protein GX892_08395 [Thermoanaerobacteraceae bacterium]|nr:hypothetical protein [Thermoanaerobacteraceae bacterium]